jgi:hypothetical protein
MRGRANCYASFPPIGETSAATWIRAFFSTINKCKQPPQRLPIMDGQHRKIELQAPADLAYLETIAKRVAREKIDRDLPPSEEGEYALRRDVERLVEEVQKINSDHPKR